MTVTCIISQFDFRAGTKGAGACMLSGNDKLAKPVTKSAIGVLMQPIKDTLERSSAINVMNVIPQARKNSDSYRLLNGK